MAKASKASICPNCNGQRQVLAPGGATYQMCPICSGTGVWIGPGDFFVYGIDFTIPSGVGSNPSQVTNILGTINILGKAFRWYFATASSTGSFTFNITDSGRKRDFQQITSAATGLPTSGMQNVNFWGTGQNVFPLQRPYEFDARQAVKFVLNDTSGATTMAPNQIELCLIGEEIDAVTNPIGG